jgi:predicted ATPase/DNA-binding SARP family transcriptional activator
MLEIHLFGRFEILLDGQPLEIPSRPAQALLAYLALHPGIAHRREKLAGLLWPDSDETNARRYLSQALWRLRKRLGDAYFQANKLTLTFTPQPDDQLDVHILTQPAQTPDSLSRSLSVYQGRLLPDFYDDWAWKQAEHFQALFERQAQTLIDCLLQEGRWRDVVEWGEHWLRLGETPEPAYRALMQAHAGLGDHSGVAAVYQRCVVSLNNDLGVEPSAETTALYERIRSENFAPRPTSRRTVPPEITTPRHNLPAQSTPFIGRKHELAELGKRITDPQIRLVTIVGPGGMGKTRLALAAMEGQIHRNGCPYSDGVFFVDLTPLNEARQIPQAIAEALQIQLTSGEAGTKGGLLAYLDDKNMLFLLDNFEHIAAGVGLVSEILKSAPGVQFLVTSRERLHLRQEQLYPISGLAFPDRESLEDDAEYAAFQLFLGTARRICPNFELVESDQANLARICQLVDGAPLALELAAGWVSLLSLSDIATEIERGLDFLETALQDMPDRHRSMQAIFETTWEHLEPAEQDMLRKLSVFRGGFTRQATGEVAGSEGKMASTLKLLGRLVDKSLLQADQAQGRYQIHELLRQYASEQLENSGEADIIRTAHSAYFTQWLADREADIKGGSQVAALDAIAIDFGNIRSAWKWALQQNDNLAIQRTLETLFWFVTIRSHSESRELLLQAMKHFTPSASEAPPSIWYQVAVRIHAPFWDYPKLTESRALLAQVMAFSETSGDKRLKLHALYRDAAYDFNFIDWPQYTKELGLPNYTAAKEKYERCMILCDDLDDTFFKLRVMDNLSWTYVQSGNLEVRKRFARQRLALARRIGDQQTIADGLGQIGWVAEKKGNYQVAERHYRDAIPLFRRVGDQPHLVEYTFLLGELMFFKGDFDRAEILMREALKVIRISNIGGLHQNEQTINNAILVILEQYEQAVEYFPKDDQQDEVWHQLWPGFAQIGLGNYPAARRKLHAELARASRWDAPGLQIRCLPAAALLAAADGRLEHATEYLALAFHHPASVTGWLEKFPLITSLRENLERELSKQVLTNAWERGTTLDLAETVATLLKELDVNTSHAEEGE